MPRKNPLEETRLRRRIPEDLETTINRRIPESYERDTRCFWSCPCGGTVPFAPEHCQWKKQRGKNKESCTDAILCVTRCPDRITCTAFKNFQLWNKERKKNDEIESCRRKRNEQ